MEEIVINDVDLENNDVDRINHIKQWDKCCFYTGMLGIVVVIGTFIVILVHYIIQTL